MSYFATHSRIGLKFPRINFRLLGLLGIVTALFSGIYGILMLGSWFVSEHLDLHHNINLLLFWPTDFLGLFVAMRWLVFCKPWPMTHNSTPFLNYYMMAHLLRYDGLCRGDLLAAGRSIYYGYRRVRSTRFCSIYSVNLARGF